MNLQRMFPTFAKLLGKNPPPSSTKTHRPHEFNRPTNTYRSLNGLNEENELDQYEVYKLQKLGADIPEQYRTWEND